MDDRIKELKVMQLKKWLDVLDLSTKGSKAELMARIMGVPPNIHEGVAELE